MVQTADIKYKIARFDFLAIIAKYGHFSKIEMFEENKNALCMLTQKSKAHA